MSTADAPNPNPPVLLVVTIQCPNEMEATSYLADLKFRYDVTRSAIFEGEDQPRATPTPECPNCGRLDADEPGSACDHCGAVDSDVHHTVRMADGGDALFGRTDTE